MVYIFYAQLEWTPFTSVVWANCCMHLAAFIVSFYVVKIKKTFEKFPDVRLFSLETVSNTMPMLKIGLAGIAFGIWGSYCYDIFAFMASFLGEKEMAAAAIMKVIA